MFPPPLAMLLSRQSGDIRPDADVNATNWTGLSGGTLFSELNETSPDEETSYIYSDSQNILPGAQTYDFTVGLSNPSTVPNSGNQHQVSVRARKDNVILSAPPHQVDIKIELLETTTVRAMRNYTDIADTYATKSFNLTAGEIASISNYNNLRIRVTTTLQLGIDFDEVRCRITQAEVSFL